MKNNGDDIVSNQSSNPTFQEIVDARLSRRGFLGGGLATAATVALGGVGALLKALPASAKTPERPATRFPSHTRIDCRHGRPA